MSLNRALSKEVYCSKKERPVRFSSEKLMELGYCHMQNFITYLVKNLVDHPDQVRVVIHEGAKTYVIEIRVGDADIAKVIGKKGRTIQALRTIGSALGAKFNIQVKLDLIQDQPRQVQPQACQVESLSVEHNEEKETLDAAQSH